MPRGTKKSNTYVTKKELKKVVEGEMELKNFPLYASNTGFGYTSGFTNPLISKLSGVSIGTGSASRVGEEIRLRRLRLNVSFTHGDTYNQVRLILFQWKTDDNTAPVINDIIDSSTISTGYYQHGAMLNSVYYPKFHVLYDKHFSMCGNGTANFPLTDSSLKHVRISIPESKLLKKIHFNGTSIVGINHIYLLAISDSSVAPSPTVAWSGFLDYVDA